MTIPTSVPSCANRAASRSRSRSRSTRKRKQSRRDRKKNKRTSAPQHTHTDSTPHSHSHPHHASHADHHDHQQHRDPLNSNAMHIDHPHESDSSDLGIDASPIHPLSLPPLDDNQPPIQTPSASSALSVSSPCNLSPCSIPISPSPCASNASISSFHFDANSAHKMPSIAISSSNSNHNNNNNNHNACTLNTNTNTSTSSYYSYSDIARGESLINVHRASTNFSHKADTPSPPRPQHIAQYFAIHPDSHHEQQNEEDPPDEQDQEMKQEILSPTLRIDHDEDDDDDEFETQHTDNQPRHDDDDDADADESERREFRFSIENDQNLRDIINHNLGDTQTRELGLNSLSTVHLAVSAEDMSHNELTSEYILSKLYNYMKISEMSKYGISVFEVTFSSYLPYLTESDIYKLATSYWCNGEHFERMIAHRGDRLKSTHSCTAIHEEAADEEDEESMHTVATCTCGPRLQLKISDNLLDAAMQSGACVDKIESMLLQKRVDECVEFSPYKKGKSALRQFYHTANERNFYLRNLKHRFWNHEVLVRVFIQNGWLTPNLADTAMKTFIKTIYHRVLDSKLSLLSKCNQRNNPHRNNRNKNIKFSENFLHSFFVSYFCLDDIPKMYKQEIRRKMTQNHSGNHNKKYVSPPLNEETLRRWCELIELLASRGANVHEAEFCKVIPLQYALQLGKNTYRFISSSHAHKNEHLIPHSYYQQSISVPDDIWDVLVSYL